MVSGRGGSHGGDRWSWDVVVGVVISGGKWSCGVVVGRRVVVGGRGLSWWVGGWW